MHLFSAYTPDSIPLRLSAVDNVCHHYPSEQPSTRPSNGKTPERNMSKQPKSSTSRGKRSAGDNELLERLREGKPAFEMSSEAMERAQAIVDPELRGAGKSTPHGNETVEPLSGATSRLATEKEESVRDGGGERYEEPPDPGDEEVKHKDVR